MAKPWESLYSEPSIKSYSNNSAVYLTAVKACRTIIRYRKEETASGWLNALGDAGIPSAVIEALYVNNRSHTAYLLTDVGGKKVAQTVAHGIINRLITN